jgi:hypothetical protein
MQHPTTRHSICRSPANIDFSGRSLKYIYRALHALRFLSQQQLIQFRPRFGVE